MAQLIIDLHKLDLGKLFEICHQWACNGVQRPIGLAFPCEINMHTAVRKDNLAVTCKTIVYDRKPLIAFHIPGALEEFIEYRIDNVL